MDRARRHLVQWSLALASCSLALSAHAQAPLLDGFGGAAGYGTSCLGPNDDGSSRVIDLTPIFPTGLQFFDRIHTSMFVNTNGNISFSEGLAAYTPSAFPIADQPIIAPFWADVDTRGRDCESYPDGDGRPVYTYAGDCNNPTENGVAWHLDAAGRRVIVTWDRVGYYRCHVDQRMSFQLVLTAVGEGSCGGGGDFDVEFRFNRCEWTTGDASGGSNGDPRPRTACVRSGPRWVCPMGPILACGGPDRACDAVPAQSGFDAGNLADFVELAGSRTAAIDTMLCTGSNVGTPGIWRFQIRSGVVECPDAGDPCETGLSGVCATGRMQCVGGGRECRPEVAPVAERCDAVDNDCDGETDEGELCTGLEVCDRGVCVGTCFEGGCAAGQVCNTTGLCIDAGCESVTCPEGERCVAGACVAACEGVSCPAGDVCRAGRCVDLCAGAICDECTVCRDGDCVPACAYSPCPSGQTCLEDGRCVESSCATITCSDGEVCSAGACVDACLGATCPAGERCELGECVAEERPDAGPPPPRDGGPPPPPPADGGGTALDAGAGVDGGTRLPPSTDPGCACRASGGSHAPRLLWLTLLAFIALALRRRAR